ncbi:MAG: hypothetical protein ACRDE8_01145, partial [Ginsengibacter sp.]
MLKSFCFLFLLFLSCSANKKINSDNSDNKNFRFLPTKLSYTGIALDDSIKYFISQYFQSRNIKIIDNDDARALNQNEIHRAAGLATSHEPAEFQKELERNQQYVCNFLELNFKLDPDSQQIDMGWKVVPFPPKFSNIQKGSWRYLKT